MLFATGTYTLMITPVDPSGFNMNLTQTFPFAVVRGAGPVVSTITIGGASVFPGGASISTFSAITVALNNAAGSNTTFSLTGPSPDGSGTIIALGGFNPSGYGSAKVTYSTTSVLSATGTYTFTITPVDPSGYNIGLPQIFPFAIATPVGPSVAAISIGGAAVNGSGTSISGFTQILVTLNAAGSGTVALNGPSVNGGIGPAINGSVAPVAGSTVAFTITPLSPILNAGAYTLTVSPVGTASNAGTPQTVTVNVAATGTNATFASSAIAFPNPAKTSAKIQFNLGLDSTVTIDIYTLTGRRVLHESQQYLASPGAQSYVWTLVNDAGNSVANGVYLVHVTASSSGGTAQFKKKILVVK